MHGTGDPLHQFVSLEVDGTKKELPEDMRTLVVLNFKCYQAGLDIWGKPQKSDIKRRQAVDDGIAEVVGIGGIKHEFKVRTHWDKGYHLGQGSQMKISSARDVCINYDGEPKRQKGPSEMYIRHWGNVPILVDISRCSSDVIASSAALHHTSATNEGSSSVEREAPEELGTSDAVY